MRGGAINATGRKTVGVFGARGGGKTNLTELKKEGSRLGALGVRGKEKNNCVIYFGSPSHLGRTQFLFIENAKTKKLFKRGTVLKKGETPQKAPVRRTEAKRDGKSKEK